MRKIVGQSLCIAALVAVFVVFDIAVYQVFTRRCISDYSDGMQAKSVELDAYLPFVDETKIVKRRSSLQLSGDLPVLDGAAALYPVFSAFVNAVYPEDSCQFDGKNFSKESALQMNNTRGAYQAVVEGTVDIAVCAKPSKEQLAYAEQKGISLELVPIGSEAFVFLVNAKNPVDSLTVDQVRGIYSGKYKNWSELGGEDKRIGALQRNEGSGSQTAMLSFMEGIPMKTEINSFLGSSIGFSFRFYVEGIVEDGGVKMLSLNGVYPDKENVKNGSYPVVSNFYAVYRKDNKNENIPLLIDWMLSEEGQEIVEGSGYAGVQGDGK